MTLKLIREFVKQALFEEVRKKFQIELPADLHELASAFKSHGRQLYVVGGSVRDALQGKEPKDYDVATDAPPDEVIQILKGNPKNKIMEIGKAFGVIVVITPAGNEYEIATFRKDIGAGRRPDSVEFTTIENDVLRRDLTINALFYDIDRGEIVDYVGGIADIENGVVKAVGSASERFEEDPLRILRAIRFAAKMGSNLDDDTATAIKTNNKLNGVSPERIRDEFLKAIRAAKSVHHLLRLIEEYDLWPQIFPGVPNVQISGYDTKNIPVFLACALLENDPVFLAKKLNALKYNAVEVQQVCFLVRFADLKPNNAFKLRKAYATSKLNDSDLDEFHSIKGEPAENLYHAFLAYSPITTGESLMAAGFSGSQIGSEMERIETERFKELL